MERFWTEKYQAGRHKEISIPEENLEDFFQARFKKFSHLLAFQSMGKKLTFNDVDIQSSQFASFLQKRFKIKKGDRVALLLPNTLQFIIASLGIFRLGAILCPLNPLYTSAELNKTLFTGVDEKGKGAVNPSLIITINKFAENIQHFVNEGKIENAIISEIGDCIGGLKGKVINFAFKHIKKEVPPFSIKNQVPFLDFLKYDTNFEKPTLAPNDTAILQFTGGTSGIIKAAILTHQNILSNVAQNINHIGLDNGDGRHWAPGDIFLGILPLFHIFALSTSFLTSIGLGYGVILIPNPRDINSVIKIWSKNKINITAGVNTLFMKLLNHKKFNKNFINFSNLKGVGSGGMAIQEKVARAFKNRTGIFTFTGYGLSETSPVISMQDRFKDDFSTSCGLPYASTDIKILSDESKELEIGKCGEICVKGPQVMKGYWQLEEETHKVFTKDGFFKTGDMGYLGHDGEIYLVDRKKDMINVSGLKVFPQEVENVANKHPGITESGVISEPDDSTGEKVVLFAVKKNKNLTVKDLLEFLRKELTAYKIPKTINFIEEIPKSPIGKILRRKLKKP
jgi:long-chain acyl-CoA synthetase